MDYQTNAGNLLLLDFVRKLFYAANDWRFEGLKSLNLRFAISSWKMTQLQALELTIFGHFLAHLICAVFGFIRMLRPCKNLKANLFSIFVQYSGQKFTFVAINWIFFRTAFKKIIKM